MAHRRLHVPKTFSKDQKLTSDMIGIGMLFAGQPSAQPNIEDTLIAASIEGLLKRDGRVISLLTDWVSIHSARIHTERLTKALFALKGKDFAPLHIYWSATAERLLSDSRFHPLLCLYRGPRINFSTLLSEKGSTYDPTDYLIKENGEDERFKDTHLRIPKHSFRHRPKDILSPLELAKIHFTYRYRIMMGVNYRADLWAALRVNPSLTAAELARKCYSSYKAAYFAKQDYELVKRDYSGRTQAA